MRQVRTIEELRGIAMGIFCRQIFTTNHLLEADEAPEVFQVLKSMTPVQLNELRDSRPAMFYEYMIHADSQTSNGLPVFHSMHVLYQAELDQVLAFYTDLKEGA